jgi:signal transduction histidine kinase
VATTVMCCVGLIYDVFTIGELSRYIVINNLLTIGIILIAVLLYYFRVIKRPVSFTIIIFTLILNILLDFITTPYGSQQILYFFRNSFFIIYLVTIASLTISRMTGVIISIIYFLSYILVTLITNDNFLNDNILFNLLIFSAYAFSIYYFVWTFEKFIHQQTLDSNIILEQNEVVKVTNALLHEKQQKVVEQAKKLRKINLELKETVATKDKFFSIMAHDLKNPLGAITGLTEIMYKNADQLSDEDKRELSRTLYESATSAYDLLDNLLIWSRMQMNAIKVNPEIINLLSLVNNSVKVLENMRIKKNIRLDITVDKGQEVIGDQYMLGSVINNLLSNAIKFTPIGGTIRISSEPAKKGMIQVCISDNGIGISHQNISRLFKIDQSYTTKGTNDETGTGLGLLLCKEFVEINEGTIWLESEPGKGSRFFFTVKAK